MPDAVVLSDLHLGSDICQAEALATFLAGLADDRPERLILNGDIFNSMNFGRLKKWHWRVLSQIRKLSDRIETVWIVGNHDGPAEDVSHLLGVSVHDEYTLMSGGRRILFQHGHQYDRFIDDHPILTALADVAYWFFQTIDPSHRIARFSKRSSKTFLRCVKKVEAGAVEYAHRHGFDAVCCGHTHHAAVEVTGPVHYFNGGSWCERPCTYLTVDEGEIRLLSHSGTEAWPDLTVSIEADAPEVLIG